MHSFYLVGGAKPKFEEISRITGGKCDYLDINNPNGSEILTNLITEKILQSVGQATGKGDILVNAYKSKFSKAYV